MLKFRTKIDKILRETKEVLSSRKEWGNKNSFKAIKALVLSLIKGFSS
jgi:hypothetical protein